MKYRKQSQHVRRYRSGRWTCVNRGIKYYNPVTGSTTHEQAKKLLFEGAKRQQDRRYAYDKATGTYLGDVIRSEIGIEGDYSAPTHFVRRSNGTVEFFNEKIIVLGSCKARNISECTDKEWRELDNIKIRVIPEHVKEELKKDKQFMAKQRTLKEELKDGDLIWDSANQRYIFINKKTGEVKKQEPYRDFGWYR